jgi:hypothetical protein
LRQQLAGHHAKEQPRRGAREKQNNGTLQR